MILGRYQKNAATKESNLLHVPSREGRHRLKAAPPDRQVKFPYERRRSKAPGSGRRRRGGSRYRLQSVRPALLRARDGKPGGTAKCVHWPFVPVFLRGQGDFYYLWKDEENA